MTTLARLFSCVREFMNSFLPSGVLRGAFISGFAFGGSISITWDLFGVPLSPFPFPLSPFHLLAFFAATLFVIPPPLLTFFFFRRPFHSIPLLLLVLASTRFEQDKTAHECSECHIG